MIILKELKNFTDGTASEIDIKNYILEHPEDVEKFSVRELGKATFTSGASVTRFCRKLGYKGYSEFKLKFVSEIKFSTEKNLHENIEILAKENVVTMARKISDVNKKAVSETTEALSFEKLKRIVEMIHKAEVVDFYSYDTSRYFAEYGCSQYMYAGKKANAYIATNIQAINALLSDKKHFAIFISHTGENGRLVEFMKILKARGTKMLVITSAPKGTMGTLADEFLLAAAPKKFKEFLYPMFFTSVKYLLDILWGLEYVLDYDKNVELNKVYDKIGEASLWGLLKNNTWSFVE